MKKITASDIRKSTKLWIAIVTIALASLLVMLASFRGCTPNWSDKEKARKGDASALARIQLHYMQNSDKGNLKEWLIIGANLNDPESIEQLFSFVALGQLTLNGKPESDWLRDKIVMVASQGNSKAAAMLGEEYLKGSTLPLDEEAAKFWLRKASAKNEHAAIYRLAKLLIERPMTPSDRTEAIQLLEILYKISPPESAYRDFAKTNLSKLTNASTP